MKIDPDTQKKIDQARAEGRVTETAYKKQLEPGEAEREEKLDEKAFQAQVIKFAKQNGWLFIYHTLNSRGSAAGYPDLCMVRERCIFMELKAEKGIVSPEQQEWIDALKRAGIEAWIFRPADWPQIEKVLCPVPYRDDNPAGHYQKGSGV